MTSKVFDLRTAMESISFCELERAKIVCEDLLESYFAKDKPNPHTLAAYHDKYATMANIVFDYILQAQKKLDEATEAVKP